MIKKERQSNIELLRIITILGVIVLHYNNPQIGGGIIYAKDGSLNLYILYFLESLFVCSVNVFLLISGYFMCESKRRTLWKPIELIVQVILFREIFYVIRIIAGRTTFSLRTMLITMLPLNYFVVLYCVLYLISPFINAMIDSLSDRAFYCLVVCSIILFSIYPTIVDVLSEFRGKNLDGMSSIGMYGSQWGYTIVNFILMYLIGAYLKKQNDKLNDWTIGRMLIVLLLCIAGMMIWARINDKIGFSIERSAWEYCNPFVILESVIVFKLFEIIDIGTNRVINKLAAGGFSVFLLHHVFIPHLKIGTFVTGNPLVMVLHILICSLVIYLICWMLHVVYHMIIDSVFKMLTIKISLPVIEAEERPFS